MLPSASHNKKHKLNYTTHVLLLTCTLLVELGFTFLLDLLNDPLVVLLQRHRRSRLEPEAEPAAAGRLILLSVTSYH